MQSQSSRRDEHTISSCEGPCITQHQLLQGYDQASTATQPAASLQPLPQFSSSNPVLPAPHATPQQHGWHNQPGHLAELLEQESDTAAAIHEAQRALSRLCHRQAVLQQLRCKMEQQQVLQAVHQGHLGFDKGRPVAVVLIVRCLEHWGLLHHPEPCAFLEQLSALLQQQVEVDDASAPADVAGLQCHVAQSLAICAVLYCVLLKAVQPNLAAAATASSARGQQQLSVNAAEVVAAAQRKVTATWQQGVAHVGPGLQALTRLRLGGWGLKQAHNAPPAAAAASGANSSIDSQDALSSHHRQPQLLAQPTATKPGASSTTMVDAAPISSCTAAAGVLEASRLSDTPAVAASGQAPSAASVPVFAADPGGTAAAAAAAVVGVAPAPVSATGIVAGAAGGAANDDPHAAAHLTASTEAFMQCLDQVVQHTYSMLRDQLKRRLSPLLAACMSPDSCDAGPLDAQPATGSGTPCASEDTACVSAGQLCEAEAAAEPSDASHMPSSPTGAAASAVAGSAAASAAHAEAALLSYRSWSELVGVLHAAMEALRGAHVPRTLRSQLMQQVLEFINCQLFNQLLLRPECCSTSNARYALRGLKQLDTWILAEQAAARVDSCHSGCQTHSVTSADGNHDSASAIHSSADSQVGFLHTDVSAVAADSVHKAGIHEQQHQHQHHRHQMQAALPVPQDSAAPRAEASAAAAAVGVDTADDDAGWEQVVAQTGSIDDWRPAAQQQQQQRRQLPWWQPPNKQQQHQGCVSAPSNQPELGAEAWSALGHIRQALQFLVFEDKSSLCLEDLRDHVCPALSHQQLYRLCTTAWREDSSAPGIGVSGDVLEQLKLNYPLSSNGGLIVTFLLDEPPGPLPFVQQPSPAVVAASSCTAAASCMSSAVLAWDDGRDYGKGMAAVPSVLVHAGCPKTVFEFLTADQQ